MGDDMPPVLLAARVFLQKGWQPIPIPHGEKAPRLTGWQKLRLTEDNVASIFGNGCNIGILLGEASGGLVDVDLDAPGALAVADTFLPPTERIHGRTVKPRSHRWYLCTQLPRPEKFSGTDGACLVELRSTGQQTLVPPSVHPSGELLRWEREGDPAMVDGADLHRAVAKVAAACLLALHWPAKGQRHEAALALAGMLLRGGWNEQEVMIFVSAIARAARDEEFRARMADVRSTVQRLTNDRTATGENRLANLVGKNVVTRLSEWLDLRAETQLEPRCTDVGNAERFAAHYSDQLRYCHDWGEWLVWDGTRWRRDRLEEARLRAAALVQQMFREAAEITDPTRRDALWKWARHSEHTQRVTAMLREAQPQPALRATSDQFDSDPWLLNCTNGTLDLRTGKFYQHRRDDLLTKLAGASYDPRAQCSRWLQFLDEITKHRPELVEFLQRAVGYALTGDTREQVFFQLHGTGSNGKSTFLETLRIVFGDYGMTMEFKTVLDQREYGVSNDVARLQGARLVIAKEVAQGKRFNESLIKELTGGDTISARLLYHEAVEFKPAFKLFLAGNHKPVVRDNSEALWRRVRLIPFDVKFNDTERDPELLDKLRPERAGILTWAVQGCLSWQKSGLGMPRTVAQATADYRNEMDVVERFSRTACDLRKGAESAFPDLFSAFQKWAEESGERTMSKWAFGTRLQELGFERAYRHGRKVFYIGIQPASVNEVND